MGGEGSSEVLPLQKGWEGFSHAEAVKGGHTKFSHFSFLMPC